MTVGPTLLMARRFRSEEELREVVTSGCSERIEAACRRAAAAGVSQALIETARAVAQQCYAGTAAAAAQNDCPEAAKLNSSTAAAIAGAGAVAGLIRARQLRAGQELRAAAQAGGAARVAAAQRRAEAAGMARADIEAALSVLEVQPARQALEHAEAREEEDPHSGLHTNQAATEGRPLIQDGAEGRRRPDRRDAHAVPSVEYVASSYKQQGRAQTREGDGPGLRRSLAVAGGLCFSRPQR
eukprot:CAMPEP_0179023244 /NCGR_PEP_ID=MMETSP0796-20121207/6827_1 /TAXON_ID=73915 /ORGANISM="Pyrodinium bahamense, Strain pbaha01" /LENGTH=240 /DNA_ID=CAMNT_0020719143 /DNA_START=96 /DNA_END=817 /DNA_ORIENTATION=+